MRLALPRPAHHPLSQMAQNAGWTPVPFAVTRLVEAQGEPPLDLGQTDAVIVLSPSGAKAASAQLPSGMTMLAQGLGTADALGRKDLPNAGSAQNQALDAMRQGAQALAEQAQQGQQGQKSGREDPLGRGASPLGSSGVKIPGATDLAKARAILEELRRRAAQMNRPQAERDYLDRLLKAF